MKEVTVMMTDPRLDPTAPWNEEFMDIMSRIADALETLVEINGG